MRALYRTLTLSLDLRCLSLAHAPWYHKVSHHRRFIAHLIGRTVLVHDLVPHANYPNQTLRDPNIIFDLQDLNRGVPTLREVCPMLARATLKIAALSQTCRSNCCSDGRPQSMHYLGRSDTTSSLIGSRSTEGTWRCQLSRIAYSTRALYTGGSGSGTTSLSRSLAGTGRHL